jgi:hypothetical protein
MTEEENKKIEEEISTSLEATSFDFGKKKKN